MNICKRALFFRVGVVVLLIIIAGIMMIIGRAHTVYFDNKVLEYQGKENPALYLITVDVKGNELQEIYKRERCEVSIMGQNVKAVLQVTDRKGQMEPRTEIITFRIPYGMDAVVINVPAYLAGLPQDAWMQEFVSLVTSDNAPEEKLVLDEFGF